MLDGLISGTRPGSNPGRGAKLGQAKSGTYARGLISWAVICHQAVLNWYQRKLHRKVTVGLASHWPCVTDNSGITTYGLTALGRQMSSPPTLSCGVRAKAVSESRVTRATSVPILVFLSLSILDLGPTYATDRRRRQTSDAHHCLMPPIGAKAKFTILH